MIFTGKRNHSFPAPHLEKRGRKEEGESLIDQGKKDQEERKTRGKKREKSSILPFFFFQKSK